MNFIPQNLEDYIASHSQPEPELLKELSRETWLKILQPRMLTGHVQGRFLSMISNIINPEYILEIGTYTGYSAICLAEGLQPGGQLHTIDINEELFDFQRKYFDRSGQGEQIIQHLGNALDIIPELPHSFDLVFIDADKTNYPNYLEILLPKLTSGALILSDNVLWSGKVADPLAKGDAETEALVSYNKLLNEHPRLQTVMLPLRDGLTLSRVADP